MRYFKILSMLVTFLSVPAVQAANDTEPNLMPNLAQGWAGLPPDVQKWVLWIISVAFVLFVVVAILYTFGGSIKALISGKRGDVAGRSSGISEAFTGVAVLLIAVIAVLLIIFIASNL
jgi:hypothetical protein